MKHHDTPYSETELRGMLQRVAASINRRIVAGPVNAAEPGTAVE